MGARGQTVEWVENLLLAGIAAYMAGNHLIVGHNLEMRPYLNGWLPPAAISEDHFRNFLRDRKSVV